LIAQVSRKQLGLQILAWLSSGRDKLQPAFMGRFRIQIEENLESIDRCSNRKTIAVNRAQREARLFLTASSCGLAAFKSTWADADILSLFIRL
jgi:hypothetical protein